MMMRLLLLATATAVMGSCSHRRSADAETAPETQDWTLTIVNHHWLDVSVYVMSEGQRSHVGLVTATRTQSFAMPARMISAGRLIVLEADPVGGPRSVRSERLAVEGGQTVQWTIETGLERSMVAVY